MEHSRAKDRGWKNAAPFAVCAAVGAIVCGFALSLAGDAMGPAPTAVLVIASAAASAAIAYLSFYRLWRHWGGLNSVALYVDNDAVPCFATDAQGVITYCNKAARGAPGMATGVSGVAALRGQFALPEAIFRRLRLRAETEGAAREDIAMRRGHIRLSAHRLGARSLLWRLDDLPSMTTSQGADGIGLPMLTATKSGKILYMNEALRRLLGRRPETLDRIIVDLPVRPGEAHTITTEAGNRRVTIVETPGAAGRRELYVLSADKSPEPVDWDLIDALPVPLLKLSRDGGVRMSNRMARTLLSFAAEEDVAFGALVEGLGRPLGDWIAEASEGRGGGRPEFLRASRAQQDIYVQVTLSGHEENGEPCAIAVLNDATELKTLEAQFVQSQKMQAIGQLAGGVAHDFNNLLTAITGHCDLLLLRRDPGDPDYADLDQINQNANRAAALVGQLLAFSRKQNLRPEILDLRDTMGDLGHLLNRLVGETVALDLVHDADTKLIRADRRQLEQVIINLVVNARDAMPEGGRIGIQTCPRRLTQELVRDRAVVPVGDYVEIRVQDEGIGIDPEHLSKIFEPFYTTKRAGEGTGLGLSTVYGIVKQTGGYIFADSTLGVGTSFTMYFPAQDQPVAIEPAAPAAPRVRSKDAGGVVLLVEDEAPVRAFASRALSLRGYTVIEAENAEEALERLADGTLQVDVFVTDVVMPGMDGPTWVAEALRDRPDTRVVFVSGYAEESVAEGQSRIPNSVFLPKPFSLNQLTETVQDQIH